MRNTIYFFIFFLLILQNYLQASDSTQSVPTPYIHGINIITGIVEDSYLNKYDYEYSHESNNQRVTKLIEKNSTPQKTIEFSYLPHSTEIIESQQLKSIYCYQGNLITSLAHYVRNLDDWILYRKELLFWNTNTPAPTLISRVLEDADGKAHVCYLSDYNFKGQLIKETLLGNLSGSCQSPLLIDEHGQPIDNGIESYSLSYEYALDDSELLLKVSEDNGLSTRYFYDADTKQCLAKLRGNQTQLLTRYFYEYDDWGFLSKTIVDDGQSFNKNDVTGISCRKMMQMQSSRQLTSYGQPEIVENLFLDISTGKEVLVDKMNCIFSAQGELIRQDFFDSKGILDHSIEKNDLPTSSSDNQETYYTIENCTISADSYGNETKCFYDTFGRAIKTLFPIVLDENDNPYQPIIIQQYDISNHVIKVQDSLGNITTSEYTIRGKPAQINYPDGSSEAFIYFLDGELKEKTARNGTRTLFSRDSLGRIISQQEFSAAGLLLNELFYSYQGTLINSITDGKSFTVHIEYDGAGRQTGTQYETKDGIKRLSYVYGTTGQILESKAWHGLAVDDFLCNQDSPANSSQVDQPESLFARESMTCNHLGQYVKLEEIVDKKGVKVLKTYDALGRLENQTNFNSLGIKIFEKDLRYDVNHQKILEKHYKIEQGQVRGLYAINWEYDASGHLIAIHEGVGSPYQKNTYYQYNTLGQLQKMTKPDGTSLFYQYDDRGLLIKSYASDQSLSYQYNYDEFKRLVDVQDLVHGFIQKRSYDSFNQLIEETNDTLTIRYQYDLAGRRKRMTLPDQSGVQYTYDKRFLSTIERIGKDQSSLYIHRYNYADEKGRLESNHLIKNIGEIHYRYDEKGNLQNILSPWWSEKLSYNYQDNDGRLLSTLLQDPLGSSSSSYTYEDDGQHSTKQGAQKNYTYDSLYNRLSGNHQDWVVNEINQLVQTSNAHYSYDVNGNLIEKNSHQKRISYVYDALNRLIRLESHQEYAIEYIYDAFNRRTAEKSYHWDNSHEKWQLDQSKKYIFDGEKEIGKTDKNGNIIELRVLGLGRGAEIGAAVAIELNGRLFAPIHDRQGSVRCLIDADDQSIAEFYRYSSYGEEQIFDSHSQKIERTVIGNYWRYFSKRIDENSSMIFFGLRNYDPEIGRWTTPDPLYFYDTPNLYAFMKNDPLNHYDLYGLYSISSLWNTAKESFLNGYQYLKSTTTTIKKHVAAELKIPPSVSEALEKAGKKLLGDCTSLLFGRRPAEPHIDVFGEKEINDKVRVTFINGILSIHDMLYENLDLISKSHGDVKVHYVFRGTKGWTRDMWQAILIRTCYGFGYRSSHAHLLVETWRELIEEMGGVDGGGVIIHYAHSLGASDTDRARTLLTPEEQKMIRVFAFGSATLVRNEGFQNVVNIISANDGVSSIILEPLGRVRNFFDSNSNVRVYGPFSLYPYWITPMWPTDHLLNGFTYKPILFQLGQNFLDEFN